MKKILVTGGAGFVGTNLCRKLLAAGNEVICLDNFSTGKRENISDLEKNPAFTFVLQDVIQPFFAPVDQIYNLACPASPPAYQKDPVHTMKTSVLGVINMLDLAAKTKATLLQASTSEVYGDPLQHPQQESYRGNVNPNGPRSCYDEGKRAAETLCLDYAKTYGVPVRIIRIFNTYGPFMDPADGRVVSNFIMQALQNKDITIYGDGSQTRSFQYIDDLIAGMIAMMENAKDFSGPVNIGTPFEFSIADFAEKILTLIPSSLSKIIYKDLPIDDPKQRKADITLAREMLGRKPSISLENGLQKTIERFTNHI